MILKMSLFLDLFCLFSGYVDNVDYDDGDNEKDFKVFNLFVTHLKPTGNTPLKSSPPTWPDSQQHSAYFFSLEILITRLQLINNSFIC